MKLAIAVLTALLVFNVSAVGEKIEPLKTLKFPEASATPLRAWDFCQTGDGVFIIPDYRAGNIKVYEKNVNSLKLVNTIGRKGYGPDGLLRPTFCSFSKEENKLVVMDAGMKKIFLFRRLLEKVEFEREDLEISCWRGVFAIQLKEEKLFISGYAEDNGNPFDFYYVDLQTGQKKFLLPSHYKYNLAPQNYKKHFEEKNISAIGVKGFFDIDKKGNTYFAWEGNLRIIKIADTVAGEIHNKETLGKHTDNYIKPSLTPALATLVEGYKRGDFDIIQSSKKKMSLIRGVFTAENHLLVIFEGPVKEEGSSSYWLQFYSLDDGKLKKEIPIPGNPSRRLRFDKDKNILYSLLSKPGGCSILSYRISFSE